MNRIILGDNQAIFRAGAARLLAMQDDMRIIAQCDDAVRLVTAVEATRGATILLSTGLRVELPVLLEQAKALGSRVILITERGEELSEELSELLDGVISRGISGPELIETIRRVGRGLRCVRYANVTRLKVQDSLGERVRDRLTPKEMQIVALIGQGCKNKDIAQQLSTTEQVIKNYLRNIYNKAGVSDRLELALFTMHHRILAGAAAKVGESLRRKSVGPWPAETGNKELTSLVNQGVLRSWKAQLPRYLSGTSDLLARQPVGGGDVPILTRVITDTHK
jgi:DNA-binding NarL/FixJ family response regulator